MNRRQHGSRANAETNSFSFRLAELMLTENQINLLACGVLFFRKYIKSFYWSVLTLMTIGETPSPQTNVVSENESDTLLILVF